METNQERATHADVEGCLAHLIPCLNEALAPVAPVERAQAVKLALESLILEGKLELPEHYWSTANISDPARGYARRLLYRCPETGVTAILMTWPPGKETCLHDHSGMWCVECVVDGDLLVIDYELMEENERGCRFEQRNTVRATVGDAGSLIPPFEYHVLKNASSERACLTLHVYAGEMETCATYEPIGDGWYTRGEAKLGYDE